MTDLITGFVAGVCVCLLAAVIVARRESADKPKLISLIVSIIAAISSVASLVMSFVGR